MTERQPINLVALRIQVDVTRSWNPVAPIEMEQDWVLALVEAVEATWLYWMQEGRGDDFEPVRLALTRFDFQHLGLP